MEAPALPPTLPPTFRRPGGFLASGVKLVCKGLNFGQPTFGFGSMDRPRHPGLDPVS